MNKREKIARVKELQAELRVRVGGLTVNLDGDGLTLRPDKLVSPAYHAPSYIYLSDKNARELRDFLNEEYPNG